METMAISTFKATCLAVLRRVGKTKKPVLITRFGRPVAEVVPRSVPVMPENWLDSMRSSARIQGDIVSPAAEGEEWENLWE